VGVIIGASRRRAALVFARRIQVEIQLKAGGDLAKFVPPSGKLELEGATDVGSLLRKIGIDGELVMLVVINGALGDMESTLSDGMTVELIPPISGG
jgi:molybdopterin converting factor small subunit